MHRGNSGASALNMAQKKEIKGFLIKGQAYEFTQKLVQKLETYLCEPEDVVVKQDSEDTDMYFIAKGDCMVT